MLLQTFCVFMEKKNEYDITVIEGNKVFHGTPAIALGAKNIKIILPSLAMTP